MLVLRIDRAMAEGEGLCVLSVSPKAGDRGRRDGYCARRVCEEERVSRLHRCAECAHAIVGDGGIVRCEIAQFRVVVALRFLADVEPRRCADYEPIGVQR